MAGTREVFREWSERHTDARNQGFGAASECLSVLRESEKTMEVQMRVGAESREQAIG